jgi:hypothetical protein
VPDDLQAPPHEVVTFVAEQLEMDPSVLTFTTQACTSGTSPVLNPNRAKWLAQIGWKSTNQHLQHHRAVLAGAPRGRKLGGGKRAWDPVEPRLVPSQTVVTAVLAHRTRLEGMGGAGAAAQSAGSEATPTGSCRRRSIEPGGACSSPGVLVGPRQSCMSSARRARAGRRLRCARRK